MKAILLTLVALALTAAPAGARPAVFPIEPVPLPTLPYVLIVEVAAGGGVVASSPAGINCPGTCSALFPSGTSVTLTATPAAGSTFLGWDGACSGASCVVAMTTARSVSARFDPVQLAVSVTGSGGWVTSSGDGSQDGIACPPTCTAEFAAGTNVRLFAVAAPGWIFQQWSGACSGGDDVCSMTMSANGTIDALFTPANGPVNVKANLTVDRTGVGAGTVTSAPGGISCGSTCGHYYPVGMRVQLTADPASGSTFLGWSGGCSGTGLVCNVYVAPDLSVTARFGVPSAAAPAPPSAPEPPQQRAPDPPRNEPPEPAPDPSPNATPDPPKDEHAVVPLADDALGLRSFRTRKGRRVVVVLDTNRRVRAYLSLQRNGRVQARARREVGAGANVLQLAVRRSAPAGRYRVVVVLVAGAQVQRLSGTVRVPS